MNNTMILRYAIELSTVLPAAFLAILPVREYKRLITKFIVFMFVILMIIFIAGGSLICTLFNL